VLEEFHTMIEAQNASPGAAVPSPNRQT